MMIFDGSMIVQDETRGSDVASEHHLPVTASRGWGGGASKKTHEPLLTAGRGVVWSPEDSVTQPGKLMTEGK